MATDGVLISALSSTSGKTLITMGLIAALRQKNYAVISAKAGPDYIDPAFHSALSGTICVNLDPFAMSSDVLHNLVKQQSAAIPSNQQANQQANQKSCFLIEGVMGLFDGGAGRSSYDLAKILGINVILVLDLTGCSDTAAYIAAGLKDYMGEVGLAGVILNQAGSMRHADQVANQCAALGIPVLGKILRDERLAMPARHLGLVQASEQTKSPKWAKFLAYLTDIISTSCDLEKIAAMASICQNNSKFSKHPILIDPPGQRISIASDAAFSFAYPHILSGWRQKGAEITLFSPLADETPAPHSDFIFLPGGYPELHLPTLHKASHFLTALRNAADKNTPIYGECGGYMVLGQNIINAKGQSFKMAGLLNLETSFANRCLHLGYRHIKAEGKYLNGHFRGHEFHYSSAIYEIGQSLFEVCDGSGSELGSAGLIDGSVFGSYMHLIAASDS